jgi:hypothetical protein
MNFETKDWIKYGAMALAAYLLWQWLTKPGGMLALTPGTGADAGTTAGGAGAGQSTTGTGTGTTADETGYKGVTEQAPVAIARPSDDAIHAAAISAANVGQTGGWKANMYEWNFWRMEAAKALGWADDEIMTKTQADLGGQEYMSKPYTAAEYHVALNAHGLEGLGAAPTWGGGPRYSYV